MFDCINLSLYDFRTNTKIENNNKAQNSTITVHTNKIKIKKFVKLKHKQSEY